MNEEEHSAIPRALGIRGGTSTIGPEPMNRAERRLARGVLKGGLGLQKLGLPWEQHLINIPWLPGNLRQLRAVGDQGWLDFELFRDAITIGPDAVLKFDLDLGQRDEAGITAGATRQCLGIALQAGADCGC